MTQVAEPDISTRSEPSRIRHWIGGRLVDGTSGRQGDVFDPATGHVTKHVDFASTGDVDAAVAAARTAFPAWRATSLSKRTDIMFKVRNLVDQRRHALAAPHCRARQGPIRCPRRDRPWPREPGSSPAASPNLLKGGFSEQASTGVDVYQIRQLLGVVAGITLFNFPAMVPMWMFANAIACGNTFHPQAVREGPLRSDLHRRAPPRGGPPTGSSTSSTRQGRGRRHPRAPRHRGCELRGLGHPSLGHIYETGTKNGKRVQALGGAKNHMVVPPDADIDMAADAAVSAGFGSAGERCMAVATIVAVGDVADPPADAISNGLERGQGRTRFDPNAEMGPLVTRQHRGQGGELS